MGSGEPRPFPLAAQPEIIRAAEKDDQFASFIYDACRDAFRSLFGTRVAVAYQNEIKLLGQMLYYVLTTGSGQQTLVEEYCDITQVVGPLRLPPTPAMRVLFIVYQTAFPSIAERISSSVASRGIVLAESQSDEFDRLNTAGSSRDQSLEMMESPYSSASWSQSAVSRLKEKLKGLCLYAIQRWPTILS